MRWFCFYDLERKCEVHINLTVTQSWRVTWWDTEDDTGPVDVTFLGSDGAARKHRMSDADYKRLDRLMLDYECTPEPYASAGLEVA